MAGNQQSDPESETTAKSANEIRDEIVDSLQARSIQVHGPLGSHCQQPTIPVSVLGLA
jgi:hypothetical protein